MEDNKENKKQNSKSENVTENTASVVEDVSKKKTTQVANGNGDNGKTIKKDGHDRSKSFRRNQGGGGRGNSRGRRGGRFERVKPEFDQKIINIRRVTRVMAGGRRFSFSVAMVAGNRKGRVGVGVGKASDTSLAIEKAFKNAKKNMVTIKLDKRSSIPHEVKARYCTSEVFIKPAKGKGIVAGSSARNVLDLVGMTDVSSKILSRSKNKINIARATIVALNEFKA